MPAERQAAFVFVLTKLKNYFLVMSVRVMHRMFFEGAQYDQRVIPFSIPDKVNAVISLVSVEAAGHL